MAEPIIYTTHDKAKRDELWRSLRAMGSPAEKQAVRFSGVEPTGEVDVTRSVRRRWVVSGTEARVAHRRVRLDDGNFALVPFERTRPRKIYSLSLDATPTERPVYRSTWSVAHPPEPLGGN